MEEQRDERLWKIANKRVAFRKHLYTSLTDSFGLSGFSENQIMMAHRGLCGLRWDGASVLPSTITMLSLVMMRTMLRKNMKN